MKDELREKRKKLILELFNDELYTPMKRKELALFMLVKDEERSEFDSILDELLNLGLIIQTGRGKLLLNEDKKENDSKAVKKKNKPLNKPGFTGIYKGTRQAFGFVKVEGMEEFYIPEGKSLNAKDGDTCLIYPLKSKFKGSHPEAEVFEIIERGKLKITGTYEGSLNSYGFVLPDDKKFYDDIYIPKEFSLGAVTGSKVLVEITSFGDEKLKPEGKVIKIIGHKNDPGVDILSIVYAFGIEPEFPEKVINQAASLAKPVSEADFEARLDLRNLKMVTIDSEEAKDLDDAVSLEMIGDIYRLGVHIADVSEYVKESSALDKEALKRGTSTYLLDRVIPMLPHSLSNGICSLNEGEDRLALSVIMDIDSKGNVLDSNIYETVINVNKRMTYRDVNLIISDNDEETSKKYEDFTEMFHKMNELHKKIRKKREKAGSIDFNLPETKIILDKEGKVINITEAERNEATMLIEDFMLTANECVATLFYWLEIPFVYRIHEKPDSEKIDKLKNFIKTFGYKLKASSEDIHSKEIQKLLESVKGKEEEDIITGITLRSMKQAKYSVKCEGHFGLALSFYCHFTSPIRRYPDLQIHRIIKDYLRGRIDNKKRHYEEILDSVSQSSSKFERRSEECEREVEKLKKVQFMEDKINEEFSGRISSVTNWGFYVILDNSVEGLVHVSSLRGDFYKFDENKMVLEGESGKRSFKLGQRVKVIIKAVDLNERTIDFVLA